MRIKKHGNKYKGEKDLQQFEKFKCDKCGCEFSCEPDEYYADLGGADCNSSYWGSSSITCSTITKDYLVCSCPECHKIVKKIKERKNNLTWTSPNITYKNTNLKPLTINGTTIDSSKTKPLIDKITNESNEAKTYTFTCKLADNDDVEAADHL